MNVKFKAKAFDNDIWVYGYYVEFIALTGEGSLNGQITLDNQTKLHCIVDDVGCVHRVHKDTVTHEEE